MVANNDGLLAYSGERWSVHGLPNRTIARSVAVDTAAARVYVGGQDAFGYYAPAPNGTLAYVDLKPLMDPSIRSFGDVWQTVLGESGDIFFQSTDRAYRYHADTIEVVADGAPIMALIPHGGDVYLSQYERGLFVWRDGSFAHIPGSQQLGDCVIVGLSGLADGALCAVTIDCGLYRVANGNAEPLPLLQQAYFLAQRVNTARQLDDGTLAIATSSDGLLLVDIAARRVHMRLNKASGLQHDNVHAVFADGEGNLWLGLDNGIDHVDLTAPFRRIIADGPAESATYDVQPTDERLYIATGNGLYAAPTQDYYDPIAQAAPFARVPGTAGQVWGLDTVLGSLLLGHHEGAFKVSERGVARLSEELGFWKYLPLTSRTGSDASTMVAGTYAGLRRFWRKPDGGWTAPDTLAGFGESSRILARDDDGNVWVAQPYRGIYRVTLGESGDSLGVRFYGEEKGLPSDLANHVFAVRNEIIVGAERGIFRYDVAADRFVRHADYERLLGSETRLVRMYDGPGGDVWYVTDDDVGVLRIDASGLGQQITRQSFAAIRPLLLGGFEEVHVRDEDLAYVGAEMGLIELRAGSADEGDSLEVLITEVAVTSVGDSVAWSGQYVRESPPMLQLPSRATGLRVTYAAPAFGALETKMYRTRLDGLERDFTPWSAKDEREFTNLAPGEYKLRVEAKSAARQHVARTSLRIEIAPPWYLSAYAKTGYIALIALGLLALYLLPQRRYAREQARLRDEQEEQARAFESTVEANERTIEELQTEKLEAELAFRHRELADTAMHLVQKNELLQRLRENLDALYKDTEDRPTRKRLRETLSLLKDGEEGEDDWVQFAYHFDQVHHGFFARLRERHPQLTPKDHKLCAYLRMNLNTKEIAPLLNISVRGVEISRYRLRKKLGLTKEVNLQEWMLKF